MLKLGKAAGSWAWGVSLAQTHSSPEYLSLLCMDAQCWSKEWGQGNTCCFCSEFPSAPAFKWPKTRFHLSQKRCPSETDDYVVPLMGTGGLLPLRAQHRSVSLLPTLLIAKGEEPAKTSQRLLDSHPQLVQL